MNDRVRKAQKLEAIETAEKMYDLIQQEGINSKVAMVDTSKGTVYIYIIEE